MTLIGKCLLSHMRKAGVELEVSRCCIHDVVGFYSAHLTRKGWVQEVLSTVENEINLALQELRSYYRL